MDDVLDVQVVEDPIVDQDAPVIDEQEDDEQLDPASDGAVDKIDGRKFNPEWSRTLKALREEKPELADMLTKLRDGYARSQAYMELAPKGLDDIRGWKTQIDALGGPEAAASLMERAATMDAVDERIASGDFTVVGELPEPMQQGFYQMIPHALSHMAESDPQKFVATVQPYLSSALKESGLGDFFSQLYTAAEGNEQAQQLIKQGYQWYNQQTQGGAAMPAASRSQDPQLKALQEKLAKYEASADDSFVSTVTDASQKHLQDSFGKLADVYIKQLNLTKEQQEDLAQSFNEKLSAKLGADAAFQNQLKAFKAMKNRSPESVTNYIRSKMDEHAKPLLDSIVKTRYGATLKRTAPRATPSAFPSSNGAAYVERIPEQSEWDMEKMKALGYDATVKQGIYHLRGGKTVQFKRTA